MADSNIAKPAPKWFRITKKIWALTENTVLAVLLATGHTDSGGAMIIYKIASSYVQNILDSILASETEDYTTTKP